MATRKKRTLAETLKEYREKRNLSAEELANRTDLDRATITNIERGKTTDIKLSTLIKIVEVLKLNGNEILDLGGWDIFPSIDVSHYKYPNRYQVLWQSANKAGLRGFQ